MADDALGTIIVTGGASGLGAAVAQAVRDAGGTAVTLDVDPSADVVVDLSDPRAGEAAVDRVAEEHGGLHGIVTAAVITPSGHTDNLADHECSALADIPAPA